MNNMSRGLDLEAITRIISAIGDDPDREGLMHTPERVIKSWDKIFGGYKENAKDVLRTVFVEGACDEMVLLKNIEFYSTCEHHMLPFFGKCSIGYVPSGRVVGISKLARLVEVFARRLQIQERLTGQIADALVEHLEPKGVMVVMDAQHFCYHPLTEVLTKRGWVGFPDLQDTDEVAAVNPKTGVMQFEKPSARTKLKYDGKMVVFKSDTIDLCVTPDHDMYFRKPWDHRRLVTTVYKEKAGLIKNHILIDQAAVTQKDSVCFQHVLLGGIAISHVAYAAFMGIFLAEGCVRDSVYSGKRHRDVVISQKKMSIRKDIEELLKSLKFPYRLNVGKDGVAQYILPAKFCDDLKRFGKSGDKFVPDTLKNAPREIIEVFLEWFGKGDGSILRRKNKQDRVQYVSKSTKLIDDIQEMLVRIGKTGAVQLYTDHARIEVRTKAWSGVLKPKEQKFKGHVYCCTVSTGALLVRYNNRTAVCGNCMTARGVEKQDSIMVTSAIRGIFKLPEVRQEFMSLIK